MRSSRTHCCNLRDSSCKPSPVGKLGSSCGGLATGELVKSCSVETGACLKRSRRGWEVMEILRPCHYARSMKANLLDDGVGDTLVLPSHTDEELNLETSAVPVGLFDVSGRTQDGVPQALTC